MSIPTEDERVTRTALRRQLAEAVVAATDGAVTSEQVLAERRSLTALGVTSLAYLRLFESLERQFGIILDLDDALPNTVDELVGLLPG